MSIAPPLTAVRAKPVGDLKRLHSRRVLARFLDGAVLLPVSIVAAALGGAGLDACSWE